MADLIMPAGFRGGLLLPPKPDARNLQIGRYAAPPTSPPPKIIQWAAKNTQENKWSAYGNHTLADCWPAAACNFIRVSTKNNGHYDEPLDPVAIDLYKRSSSYNPTTGTGDAGCYSKDLFKAWKQGVGPKKHVINGYAAVPNIIRNDDLIRWNIFGFGCVFAGVNLPQSAIDQYRLGDGHPFEIVTGDKGVGKWGHMLPLFGYRDRYCGTVTWGVPKLLSFDWLWQYVVELWVVLTPDWTPLIGFNRNAFMADVQKVAA